MLDPALDGTDPAAPLTQPLPAPPAPNPQDADADGYSLLAALADPDAAASNPQRFWQQRRPALPIRAYEQEPTDDEIQTVVSAMFGALDSCATG